MKSYLTIFIILTISIINNSHAQQKDSPTEKPLAAVPLDTTSITTTMNSSWTWANPVFQHYWGYGSYYYDVFKVVTSVTGDYKFTSSSIVSTYGYLYLPSFNPTSSQQNMISYGFPSGDKGQFGFTYNVERSVSYYLVVTTSGFLDIGQYQLIVTGPARVTLTRTTPLEPSRSNVIFESVFTHLHPSFEPICSSSISPYDIFSIVPQADGNYTIESVSQDGSVIQLYYPSFDPLASKFNLAAMEQTSAYRSRLRLNVTLLASNRYFLILSNNYNYQLINYRVTFLGSSGLNVTKLTDTVTATIKTSSTLTKNSPRYTRPYADTPAYYYKVFHITVRQVGLYSFLGYSSVNLDSYLYERGFSTMLDWTRNLIYNSYYTDPTAKFVYKAKLWTNKNFYLVITTDDQNVTGAFNFTAVGSRSVNISAVPDSSTSTITLSSSLTSASRQFRRCETYYGNYYYRLFNVSVPSSGLYTIKTVGSMDTFGCFYMSEFNPNDAGWNLLSYDDQSAGDDQFAITAVLHAKQAYYLAVTTNRENRLGSFKVTGSGPAKMTMRVVDKA